MDLVKLFLISEVIWIVSLFGAMMILRIECRIPYLLLIATVPSLVFLLPLPFFVNLIGSTAVMYTLMVKMTDAEYFPDAVLWVGVSNIFYLVLGIWLIARFG
jgi:hypothetical protein